MRSRNWWVWAGILCMAGAMTCRAADWHVAMNGNDAADGTSWATAKLTIQAGVDAAADGDTVWVSNGVYGIGTRTAPGSSLPNRVVIEKDITVRSVNGPGSTVIRGEGNVRCVRMTAGTLMGFTVANGNCLPDGDNHYDRSGAGISMYPSTQAKAVNCLITGNAAMGDGGGADGGNLFNCTVVKNNGVRGLGGVANASVYNCIVLSNERGNLKACTCYYTCSSPRPVGVGNIEMNPQFVDAPGGNFRLQETSPCIDAGDNAYVQTSTDPDGNPRIAHGVVDMGVYENQARNWLILSPASTKLERGAVSGRVITVRANKAWTATTNVPWLAVTSGHSGTTNGTIQFNVAGNPFGNSPRTGAVVVVGGGMTRTCRVVQAGIPYELSIDPASTNLGIGATIGNTIAVAANTAWTASTNVPWLFITSGHAGTTNGWVVFSASAFVSDSLSRTGAVVVRGGGITRTCTVVQTMNTGTVEILNLEVKRSANAGARSFTACRFELCQHSIYRQLKKVQVDFYLSRDKVFGNGDDRKIGSSIWTNVLVRGSGRSNLFTYQTNELDQVSSLWRPGLTGTGSYYLFAEANISEYGSRLASYGWTRTAEAFRYYAGRSRVDWVLRNLRVTRPANADSRRFKSCQFELVNHGPVRASGDVRVEFYLSRDTTFGDGDDRKIGETTLAGLTMDSQARRTFTLGRTRLTQMTRQWTAGLAGDGMYYVFARAMAQSGFELREGDNHASTPSRFRYSTAARSAKGDGAMSVEKSPVLAWARSGGEWRLAPELVDGDTNGVWTGLAGSAPWAVAVDFRRTVRLGGVETLFDGEPWSRGGMLGTEDLLEWFDLGLVTNWPVPCRAIFLELQEEAGEAPGIREIRWEEEP